MNIQRYKKSFKKMLRRLQTWFFGGRKILVLGDSHCGSFEYCFDQGLLVPHWLNCEIVGGSTAYGLNSDSSATQAWQKFNHSLRRFPDFDVVLIALGECDCSFALWKKAERLNVAPDSLIEHSMKGIRRLVLAIRQEFRVNAPKVILVGSILPTVNDASAPNQDNLMRRSVVASQKARTQLVLRYNDSLRTLAAELGVGYFDFTRETMNPESGLVDGRFLASPEDHHLSYEASAVLWATGLRKVL